MKSAFYTGTINHRRFSPKRHEFTYRVCYYFLDLDELPQLFRFPLLFSQKSPALLAFRRKDYFNPSVSNLKQAISELIREKTGKTFSGTVRILTNIATLGLCFNPVSFYYCYDGEELRFVVSEITNTPWGERHAQVFEMDSQRGRFEFAKDFHVSPFMPMNIDYTWTFEAPEENLRVLMQNRPRGEKPVCFDTTLLLKKKPFSVFNVIGFFFLYPLMSLRTMLAIYFQAALLYFKVPFYPHPSKEIVS